MSLHERYKQQLQAIARDKNLAIPADWHGLDALEPLFERLRRDGVTVVLKIDGQSNAAQPYMALLLGGPLNEDFVRVTSARLDEAVGQAIVNYARRYWGFAG